ESQATTTQDVVNLLNGIYAAGTYARGNLNGNSTGSGTQGIVYNTHDLQLVGEAAVGTASGSGQPRQTMRYRLRPAGQTAAAAVSTSPAATTTSAAPARSRSTGTSTPRVRPPCRGCPTARGC